MTVETALVRLNASDQGLSAEEVDTRLKRHGPNRLPEPAGRSRLARLLSHFHNLLIYVLLASAITSMRR